MTGIVTRSTGGHFTLSGGTRGTVKPGPRPWQVALPERPGKNADCALCSQPQLDEHKVAEGWKTFRNLNTPFPFHRLLIPAECWNTSRLRTLGGPDILEKMFRLALGEIGRTRTETWPTWIYTHIGYGAGQNFPHLHWHLCGAPTPPAPIFGSEGVLNALTPLWESERLITAVGGVFAGQTIIRPYPLPKYLDTTVLYEDGFFHDLAVAANRVVGVFNRKFNWPDYCLLLAINGPREWHVRYTPRLNNWGGSEFAALDYGTPFVLPWPHEATGEYLLKED